MTPEQVSALSDAELNRAMIWLYPPEGYYWVNRGVPCVNDDRKLYKCNYLTDYNLTMPLVIEYEIDIDIDNDIWGAYHKSEWAYSENYLRAACECLVLIALADK